MMTIIYAEMPLGFSGLSLRAFFPRHCEEQSDEAISGKPVDLGRKGAPQIKDEVEFSICPMR